MASVTIQDTANAQAAGFRSANNLDSVPLGSPFEVTWTFVNSGGTSWDGNYRFAYTLSPHPETSNHPRSTLGQPTVRTLSELGVNRTVAPGQSVDITLTFTAPNIAGTYATNWQLQTPDRKRFGPVRWLRVIADPNAAETGKTRLAYQTVDFVHGAGDFTNMQPNLRFSGIWTLKNMGTATWTGDFRIRYLNAKLNETMQMLPDQMGAPAVQTLKDVSGRDSVAPGETVSLKIDLVSPANPGTYAFHWALQDENGRSFNGTRWLTATVVAPMGVVGDGPEEPKPAADFQSGMNLNPEAHGLDLDRLKGIGWVRYPFFVSRLNLTPEQAYQQRYRHIIQSYAAQKTKSLLVLHQDTYWGNAPWDNGGWDNYATMFAQICGRVAQVCSEFGDMVAYQIFNEQDSGPSNKSAIGLPADKFAIILDRAVKEIRKAHPKATIVIGGLNSGPVEAVKYLDSVKKTLNGKMPVDAIAYHPYGRYVKTDAFYDKRFGTVADAFNHFKKSYPKHPLWITEFGIPGHQHVIDPEHYPSIATYLREVTDEITDNFSDYVPVAIWFGWTDLMENAGILDRSNRMKAHIKEAYEYFRDWQPEAAMSFGVESDSFALKADAEFMHFSTTLKNYNAVPAQSTFSYTFAFKNTGNTTWDDSYSLVHVTMNGRNNAHMTSKKKYKLSEVASPAPASPGAAVTFRLDMTAPEAFGKSYVSKWQLRDNNDNAIGHFYAEITVVQGSTVGSNVRKPDMAFIKDHTIPDQTRFTVGDSFDKQWQVRNSGARKWSDSFRLVFVEGDLQMARNVASHIVPDTQPGETAILTVPMTAPPTRNGRPTTFKSMWRLQDDRNNFFGDPIWANIVSQSGVSSGSGGTITQDSALNRLLNDKDMWYSQKDPQWSGDRLGFGWETIGSWGCLMTCMAMALTAYGTKINPREMNNKCKATGGFFNNSSAIKFAAPYTIGGLYNRGNYASLQQYADGQNAVWKPNVNPITRIDNALASGEMVIAQVDYLPTNGTYDQHWVVIVKRTPDGSDYLMIDPYTLVQHRDSQPASLMAKYGRKDPSQTNEQNLRRAIRSVIIYHKPGGVGG